MKYRLTGPTQQIQIGMLASVRLSIFRTDRSRGKIESRMASTGKVAMPTHIQSPPR
jgi:hypothetical protein